MQAAIVILVIIIALVVIVALWFVAVYNGFVRLRNKVEESWRQVDVELHRRYDLIPNLVETVKGYATHERGVFDDVARARSLAAQPGSSPAEQAAQENQLTQAIGRLFAVAEAYPELKANANFQALQGELTSTEDRIAAGRRYYNANVRELNTRLETFPSSIVGGMTGFRRATYFEAEGASRDVPRVDFGQGSGSASGATRTENPTFGGGSSDRPTAPGAIGGGYAAAPTPQPTQPYVPQQPGQAGQPPQQRAEGYTQGEAAPDANGNPYPPADRPGGQGV